ncbi:MAG: SDR family NAD(P)-dependent oxidoreductase [Proteobacteria bacterium]|nr:SDR family NAD(P)-dependent oxidoreductase [Pseudomonadota bacterium]
MSKTKVRTALVCASSKGLGLASAHALADDGHQIIICSRDEERLKNVALTLQRPGSPKPLYFASDLSRPDQIPKLLKSIYSAVESIDILVNNVGGPPPSAAANTDYQSWVYGFEQLFLSSVLMSQNVLGHMKQNNWGRIITITSLSVVEPIEHLVVSTSSIQSVLNL